MNQVVNSWEIDLNADRWKWGIGFLTLRGFDPNAYIYNQPDSERLSNQVKYLVDWCMGSRNWIVCISQSSTYVRNLFEYVLASYVFTTGNRAIAVDVDDLIEAVDNPEGEKRDIIEFAELLLINYCDPSNTHLKFKRGGIANILHRRKHRRFATVFNLFVKKIPDKMNSSTALSLSRGITDVFGDSTFELFTDTNSKRVVVREE